MPENETPKECACTQNLRDLLRAAAPKNNPLRKVTCINCGKIFWTNSDKDYCFNCQDKKKNS
ncbi:MAG: hypothetical protein QG670_335 [Thermoproteota archaeon]|nr:hypothetical protein [Thermoproteota archaeon]